MTERLDLSPATIDAIADAVASRLSVRPAAHRLVDAAELAGILGVSRAFIYSNADRLGVVRLGDGNKPRLRFNVATAIAAHQASPITDTDTPLPISNTPRRASRRTGEVELLPIRRAA